MITFIERQKQKLKARIPKRLSRKEGLESSQKFECLAPRQKLPSNTNRKKILAKASVICTMKQAMTQAPSGIQRTLRRKEERKKPHPKMPKPPQLLCRKGISAPAKNAKTFLDPICETRTEHKARTEPGQDL